MSLLNCAIKDMRGVIGSLADFSVTLTFISPNGSQTATVVGHGMSHHISYGTEGQVVNGKNSHITVVEKDLVDAGYTVRNAKNRVSLTNHRVSFIDSNGVESTYKIDQVFPDEVLGIITCIVVEVNV